jgi:N-acetylglucosaminyl-diphospho-decaprenol L-rhamnosyltransferase
MSPRIPTNAQLCEVTVIVVTYNSAHCLPALQSVLTKIPHLIFVDNASNDRTAEMVTSFFPNAQLMVNEKNVGFGAANNLALRQTHTKFALILNPDTLPDLNFFHQMVQAAEQFPEAAMIAPQLVRGDDSTQVNYRWPSSRWNSRGPAAEGPCCVGFLCGAAVLLNMQKMAPVGFFDENFFLYYEDEDLSQRAFNLRAPMVVIPHIRLTHLSRGSVKGQAPLKSEFFRGYHHAQSKLLFEQKHGTNAHWLRWKTLILALLLIPFRILIPQPKYMARLIGRVAGLFFAKSLH